MKKKNTSEYNETVFRLSHWFSTPISAKRSCSSK